MLQMDIPILENSEVGHLRYKMVLYSPELAKLAEPGQFLHVRVSPTFPPLLRRPFSIHRVEGGERVEVLYKVVGPGTQILSRKAKGDVLNVIGPLGNGYRARWQESEQNDVILVAGGMGVASLLFLAESISVRSIFVLIGARSKEELLCEEDFRRVGCQVEVATEDGTKGYNGRVSDLLDKILRSRKSKPHVIACGPNQMLESVAKICNQGNIPCLISLEERLACGVGACLGCVVKVKDSPYGYRRVCRDGPVFDSQEIIW